MIIQQVNVERFGLRSDFEADEAHQLDAIAFRNDTWLKFEVEAHFAISDGVLEVDVAEAIVLLLADVGEREVVSANEANGAACEESADDAFGSDEAVFGVGALEEFVEEKEDGRTTFCEVADLAEAGDFGIEAGAALVQGIIDEDACS
jgi:hypothetical protein